MTLHTNQNNWLHFSLLIKISCKLYCLRLTSMFIWWTQSITVQVFINQFASFSKPETLHLSEEQDSYENNLLFSVCIYSYTGLQN